MLFMLFNSSAGLLLYAALVDLLAEDFLSAEARRAMVGKKRAFAFTLVLAGGMYIFFVFHASFTLN